MAKIDSVNNTINGKKLEFGNMEQITVFQSILEAEGKKEKIRKLIKNTTEKSVSYEEVYSAVCPHCGFEGEPDCSFSGAFSHISINFEGTYICSSCDKPISQ